MLSSSRTPWNSSKAVLIRPVAGAGAHTSATAQGVSNVWEWTPATSGGLTMRGSAAWRKIQEKTREKSLPWTLGNLSEPTVLGCVLPITWMCYSVPHLIDGLDPSYTFRCCTFRCFTILCGSMAFMGSKHLQHTPKNGVWWVWGGKIMENHSIYPLVNQHSYGKSLFIIGKSTINDHFTKSIQFS